jgi:hypothetical protein
LRESPRILAQSVLHCGCKSCDNFAIARSNQTGGIDGCLRSAHYRSTGRGRLSGSGAGVVPIRSYVKEGAFGPEMVAAMGAAFQDVCKTIEASGRSELTRETIAAKIIELARTGEADPVVLREMTLSEFGLSRLSKS